MKPIHVSVFLMVLVLPLGSAFSETITSSEYLPLADGNSWTYSLTGTSGSYTETVTVLPGTTIINGIPTKAIQFSSGDISYLTSDSQGIRLHGEFYPDDSTSIILIPPLVWAKGTANIPETLNSAGTVIVDSPQGSGSLNYTYTSNVEAKDTTTVPAGTFNTVRLSDTLHIFGTIGTDIFDYSAASTTWFARYIGQIKENVIDSDGSEVWELISTNVQPPPPPPPPSPRALPFLPLLLD